jgi:hypothetical protein
MRVGAIDRRKKNDYRGIRTLALADQHLKLAP